MHHRSVSESLVVREVGAAEQASLIATLTLAFAEDPVMRYLYPEPATYLTTMPEFVAAFCGPAFSGGLCLAAEQFLGVACWVQPGGAAADFPAALFSAVEPTRLREVNETLKTVAGLHPQQPHWYLPQIGVDPGARGRGLGAALLAAALERIDESGAPAFLESSNPRNVSLYQRYGFEALEAVQVGNAPPMIPMVRAAAAS